MIIRIYLLILLLFSSTHYARSGDFVGNGGDFIAAQFIRYGYKLHHSLASGGFDQVKELKELSRSLFLTIVKTTIVRVVDYQLYDNTKQPVDARYIKRDGDNIIEINKHAWSIYLDQQENMSRLVLHEYLRVLKINDDGYRVSGQISFNGQDFDRDLWRDLSNSFIKASPITIQKVLGSYSGRCFTPKRSTRFLPSALLIEGQAPYIIEGEPYTATLKSDFFDRYSAKAIAEYMKGIRYEFSVPYYHGKQLVTDHYMTNSQITLKKSKNMIMLSYTALSDLYIDFYSPEKIVEVKKGELWTICFYLHKK